LTFSVPACREIYLDNLFGKGQHEHYQKGKKKAKTIEKQENNSNEHTTSPQVNISMLAYS
jgi:hypothetical protein